jgi:Cu+-exporting ATPase
MSTTKSKPATINPLRLNITGMSCAACQIHVQRALEAVPGVTAASVNLMAHTAQVSSSAPLDTDALITAVHNSGYTASLPSTEPMHTGSALMDMEGANLGLRTLLALIAGAIAMLLSMPLMHSSILPMPAWIMQLPEQPIRWLLCALSLAVMLFAAPQVYAAAWRAALHRSTNMNTLVALGTIAAFASSFATTVAPAALARHGIAADVYFEAVILILAFLLAGRWLESRARARATSALESFAQLQPADARLLNVKGDDYANASETLLPVSAIETNDILRILPGDRIPVDAVILAGQSSIDESMLTGEPLPVTRTVGAHVAAGTLNLDGALAVRATAVGAASTLAQMQRLLDQAQSSRAPMQRLADRASAIFVPTVLALASLTFATWAIIGNTAGHHQGLGRALSIAIAVLIIACPCAMGLAVPAAVTVSIGRAAQSGLLIKGGEALERLATIDTICMDKTGTLTEGRPEIATITLAADARFPASELLTIAAAAERLSTHPLAHAVVAYAQAQSSMNCHPERSEGPASGSGNPPSVTNLRNLPGAGLTCTITLNGNTHTLSLGNASLLPTPNSQLPASAGTPLYLILGNHLEATFLATDELRPTSAEAITQLATLRIHPIMLTGDIAASAEPIAASAHIDDVRAHLLPAQKLEAIRQLQSTGHKVAMVGDGINDAAALAQADIGLAMGSGSDLAREAGEILLLHPDLRLVPTAVRIARRTVRIMRQNLGWAVAYNLIGVPIAAGVLYPHFHILLSPILASAAMALSSVSVLLNSLRLRRL